MRIYHFSRIVVAGLILLSGPSLSKAEIFQNKQSAENAKYACAVPKGIEAITKKAVDFNRQKHDKNKLGCAADLLYEAAKRSPKDLGLHLLALGAHVDYLEHVNVLNDYDVIGINGLEWQARTDKASHQVREIIQKSRALSPDNAVVLTLQAIAEMEATRLTVGPKESVATVKKALGLLEQAMTIDPAVLDGLPLIVMGRVYYELPVFYGGDTLKAIDFLEQALQKYPHNIQLQRFLVEAYEQELEEDKAKATLNKMLLFGEPAPEDRQLYADEYRAAMGLSDRMGATEIKQQLEKRRQALLAAHPELLSRFIEAQGGHFGENPITGERNF